MTEERIKSQNIHGQENLEAAHQVVGRSVRKMVQEQTGKNPEDLPVERRLPDLHGQLKIGQRKMKAINGKHPAKKTTKKSKKKP